VTYILTSVPKSLPHRLSAKLSTQLAAIDYTTSNALRISSEVRRALKGPANDVRIGLQRNVEKLQLKKEETNKIRAEASDAAADGAEDRSGSSAACTRKSQSLKSKLAIVVFASCGCFGGTVALEYHIFGIGVGTRLGFTNVSERNSFLNVNGFKIQYPPAPLCRHVNHYELLNSRREPVQLQID
jgi:hypothetical protein